MTYLIEKYLHRSWTATKGDNSLTLVELVVPKGPAPRTLLVNQEGVFECARDGSAKPLALFDCGPATLTRLSTQLIEA